MGEAWTENTCEFACTAVVISSHKLVQNNNVRNDLKINLLPRHIRADPVQKVSNHGEAAPLLGMVGAHFYERRRWNDDDICSIN